MDALAKIVETLAWPVTAIIVVLLLRSPLSELVPTLKRLKYKDLELEFEREANKILSEAERDLPEIQEKPKPKIEDTGIMYSRRRLDPAIEVIESWRSLELDMRELAKTNNIEIGRSIRSLVAELEANNLISKEIARVALDLASLRNKVAHTNERAITYDVSSAFSSSVSRVKSAMKGGT